MLKQLQDRFSVVLGPVNSLHGGVSMGPASLAYIPLQMCFGEAKAMFLARQRPGRLLAFGEDLCKAAVPSRTLCLGAAERQRSIYPISRQSTNGNDTTAPTVSIPHKSRTGSLIGCVDFYARLVSCPSTRFQLGYFHSFIGHYTRGTDICFPLLRQA